MDETVTGKSDARLVVQAMCCVIAADGRVSGSEIDVVFDAMAGIGLRLSKERFRDEVIGSCKRIHRRGVLAVAEGLISRLEEIRGSSLAATIQQLQDDVMRSDGRVTESEKAVVAMFRNALSSPIADDPVVETPATAAQAVASGTPENAYQEKTSPLHFTLPERAIGLVLKFRQHVDAVLGARLPLAVFAAAASGTYAVAVNGHLSAAPEPATEAFALVAALLFLGSDRTLRRISEDSARERVVEANILRQALEAASSLQPPPKPDTDAVAVAEPSDTDEATAEMDGERLGYDAVLRLLGSGSGGNLNQTKVARRLFGLLRGSRQSGGGRRACRCTKCGRKYWFRYGADGTGAICPYCGVYQHVVPDWTVPEEKPAVYVPPTAWPFAGDHSSSYWGPVTVRGYVNKRGKWVTSHTRSRPKRRSW